MKLFWSNGGGLGQGPVTKYLISPSGSPIVLQGTQVENSCPEKAED